MRRRKPKRLTKRDVTAYILGKKPPYSNRPDKIYSRNINLQHKFYPKDEMNRSIFIWINTYNRPDKLKLLLNDIYQNKKQHKLKILIIDDNSYLDYDEVLNNFQGKLNIEYQKMNCNHGKKEYWKLCSYGMGEIKKNIGYDYYIKMDDDGRLVNNFFDKCIHIWESISDKRKICLNFRVDSREKQKVWTNVAPVLVEHNNITLYKSQWVDMDFFTTFDFFVVLRFRIEKPVQQRWKNPYMSSGTGRDISKRLHRMGYSLYMSTETLVIHDDHDSVMNPGERKRNPLTTKKITNPYYGEK